jgi:hypothetical protein
MVEPHRPVLSTRHIGTSVKPDVVAADIIVICLRSASAVPGQNDIVSAPRQPLSTRESLTGESRAVNDRTTPTGGWTGTMDGAGSRVDVVAGLPESRDTCRMRGGDEGPVRVARDVQVRPAAQCPAPWSSALSEYRRNRSEPHHRTRPVRAAHQERMVWHFLPVEDELGLRVGEGLGTHPDDVGQMAPPPNQTLTAEDRDRLANLGKNGQRNIDGLKMTHCVPNQRIEVPAQPDRTTLETTSSMPTPVRLGRRRLSRPDDRRSGETAAYRTRGLRCRQRVRYRGRRGGSAVTLEHHQVARAAAVRRDRCRRDTGAAIPVGLDSDDDERL